MVRGPNQFPYLFQRVVHKHAHHILTGHHHFPGHRVVKFKHVVDQHPFRAVQFPFLFTGADDLPQLFFTAGNVFVRGIGHAKKFCDPFGDPKSDAHQRTGQQIHHAQRGHQMYDDFFHLVPHNDAWHQLPDHHVQQHQNQKRAKQTEGQRGIRQPGNRLSRCSHPGMHTGQPQHPLCQQRPAVPAQQQRNTGDANLQGTDILIFPIINMQQRLRAGHAVLLHFLQLCAPDSRQRRFRRHQQRIEQNQKQDQHVTVPYTPILSAFWIYSANPPAPLPTNPEKRRNRSGSQYPAGPPARFFSAGCPWPR